MKKNTIKTAHALFASSCVVSGLFLLATGAVTLRKVVKK